MNDPLYPNAPETEGELELTHSDKAAGIFTEPSATFAAAAKFPPKTVDWLLPLIILIVVASLSNIILTSNPEIKRQIVEKQMEGAEKSLAQMVQEGKMTEAEAQTALDNQREMFQKGGAFFTVISIVSITVMSFIIFFIISGILYLLSKLALKGEGTYASAMVATGLPYYIYTLQAIV
ncbi:MAG TPA: YIP1 family protein, partial [Ignavibacteriales bacterium]|nr:YIP1 family protein [Ignavibacteriales bacterium]